jgi:aspartate racemase
MEEDFYKRRLKEKFNLSVLIPGDEDREIIHSIIFKELVQGVIEKSSREKMLEIIEKLVRKGAEGIILGCTEIPLLIKQVDVNVPLFDTTTLHARHAVEKALE